MNVAILGLSLWVVTVSTWKSITAFQRSVYTDLKLLSNYNKILICLAFTTQYAVGAVVQLVEYRTRNHEAVGSTHRRSPASNLEQVANLLCAEANSASYPQRDEK